MELPKTKLEQLELEHEATLTTVFFYLKSNISMRYDISKATAPAMPNLGKGTECIRLLLSQTSKDMHEPLVPMLFPVLGAHVSGAEFQYPDLTWKEPTGMMANLVGDSGCNKGQLSNLVEAICRDFRQHDEAELKKLVEWSKQVKQKASTKEKPGIPDGWLDIRTGLLHKNYYKTTMGTKRETRGVRNCNPLNIRIGNNWKGERPTNSDGVFEQFTDMRYGLRAAFILLRRYITKYRLCTIRAIVRRWAPETENLTLAYINHVERLSGIDAGEPISATDKESLFRIVTAMCWVESLYKPSREELEEGWRS